VSAALSCTSRAPNCSARPSGDTAGNRTVWCQDSGHRADPARHRAGDRRAPRREPAVVLLL
jgi:hypothetical protein